MAKFKSKAGHFFVSVDTGTLIEIGSEVYETTDKKVVEALRAQPDVQEVKGKKK